MFETKMIKQSSFNNCPFKVKIPTMKILGNDIEISFSLLKSKEALKNIVLDYVKITDGLKKESKSASLLITSGAKNVVFVPIKGQPYLTDLTIQLSFLTAQGAKLNVFYFRRHEESLKFQYLMLGEMSASDKDRYIKVVQEYMSQSSKPKAGEYAEKTKDTQNAYTIPSLEDYKRAIFREMYFLRDEGGRKYKITNGSFISYSGSSYSYSFELESEVHISDDAPITITVGTKQVKGNVLICEGFDIVVVVDGDLGKKVSSAFMSVEPWKLLESLNKRLGQISKNDTLALKLLEKGPQLRSGESHSEIPKGQNVAKRKAMNSDITIIWGPPGTGKTHTMSEIAIDFMKKNLSVLIVSHSNISVDGVASKIAQMLRERNMESYLAQGKVLRYGHVRDEKLSQDEYAVSFNYAKNKNISLKTTLEKLLTEKERIKASSIQISSKRLDIEKQIKKVRAEIREYEQSYVLNAKIVATTVSKIYTDKLFENEKYDVVMFDEVSMAYVPQIVCAAAYARQKLICVGDFRQLAPIVQSDAKKKLSPDIFAFLGISNGLSDIYAHPWLVLLDTQRRMHPDISAFPNKNVYHRLLRDHESVQGNRKNIVEHKPFSSSPMNLIDLTGTYCAASKNSDNSRFNILSAVIAFSTAISACKDGEDSVGIITPYVAQTRLIRAMIQDYKNTQIDISCSTVHQFQGSERNVIIFDAVESYPSVKPGWLMSKNENGSISRLINVAVTRAKGKFIAIANRGFWFRKFEGTHHAFYQLIKHLMENNNTVGVKDKKLAQYIDSLDTGNKIKFYTKIKDAISVFEKDIIGAKNKILISIPDGKLNSDYEKQLLSIIQTAKRRGVKLMIQTADYSELPEQWKQFAWASDNAIFPLIIIDDKIIWYGLPVSDGRFTDGSHQFFTLYQTVFRITGEHTIEMIKSLSDYEMRIINDRKSPMHEKNNSNDETGKGEAGLAAYVNEQIKCSMCRQPMKLVRSRRERIFLQCPSCTHVEYLTSDFTNLYIRNKNVKCPIHKSNISARLGKSGIYILCDCGHFMKPDEI